jgi:hypothetical protein
LLAWSLADASGFRAVFWDLKSGWPHVRTLNIGMRRSAIRAMYERLKVLEADRRCVEHCGRLGIADVPRFSACCQRNKFNRHRLQCGILGPCAAAAATRTQLESFGQAVDGSCLILPACQPAYRPHG